MTINSEEVVGESRPAMSIQVPRELVQMFGDVRAVSFLYYDVEKLFPDGQLGANNQLVLHTYIASITIINTA